MGVAANTDSSVHIDGKFWASKEEGVRGCAVSEDDAGNDSPLDDEIETCFLEFILKTEDLIEDARFVRIDLLKTKGQDLHSGSWEIGGKPWGRAVCLDSDLFSNDDSGWISKAIKDSVPDVVDDAFELNALALLAKVGAAFVPGVGREKGSVGS
ncbi:MAG: hypothetical protein ABIE47_04525, partial [Pseudomonadota bacterium]